MAMIPRRRWILGVLVLLSATRPAHAQSRIVGWGYEKLSILTDVPQLPPGRTYVQIDAGSAHAVALRSDGIVLAWGANDVGQCNVPSLPGDLRYVQVQAGTGHTVALLSDGSVVAWGWNRHGQCDVPPLPPGVQYVEVRAGYVHTVARRTDGVVVGFGFDLDGQCDVPPPPPGLEYVELAAGIGHTLARVSDGSVLGFGRIEPAPPLPRGLVYVEISSALGYAIARRSDGAVVGWGDCGMFGQCIIPDLPSGLVYERIDAGLYHSVALRSDGAVVAAGYCLVGECDAPPLGRGLKFVDVAAGNGFSLGRYEGCPTCELPFCLGDGGNRSEPCPCANDGASGHGCENSASTGGARLSASGSVDPDSVVLEVVGQTVSTTSLFFQGSSVRESAAAFGDGTRCIGGVQKRIAVRQAVAGTSSYPGANDPSVSDRSAALGDPIAPGSFRYYQVLYRDADPGFCTASTLNASNAVMVAW